jgi:hypothetical protein
MAPILNRRWYFLLWCISPRRFGAELWALDHRQFIMQKPLGGRHFQFHDAKNHYAQTELLPLIPLPSKPNAVRRAANKLRRLLIGQ